MAAFGTFFEGELSWLERGCLASFIAHGHAVTLYSYAPMALPAGVAHADAAAILPRDLLFRNQSGAHAGGVTAFANLFRYAMLRDHGGIWIDTDMLCLSRDWPEGELIVAAQSDHLINCAVLGGAAGHPLFTEAFAVASRIGAHSIFGYTGPHLVTALVNQMGLRGAVLPVETFYPIPFQSAAALLEPAPGARRVAWPERTVAVHLWHESLRLAGFDRAAPPPPDSLLALLLAPYRDA